MSNYCPTFISISVRIFTSILLLFTSYSIFAAAPGAQFRVNTYTLGNQYLLDMSMGTNGHSIVLWKDAARGNYSFMKRYSGDTALQADDWYIGNSTEAAVDGAGNYVAVYSAADGSGTGVYATVYDQFGNIKINTFRVNSIVTGNQNGAYVAMSRYGEFAVAWTSDHSGVPAVYARKFNANGVALSSDVMTSSVNGSNQYAMGIAMAEAGQFAVTWYSFNPAGSQIDIHGRRLDTNGTALGSAFLVNTYTTNIQAGNTIAMDAVGNFVIAWESYGQDGDQYGIYAQRYSSTGSKLGTEFRVNSITAGSQQLPSIGMSADGAFVIAWQHDNRSNDPSSFTAIYAREYSAGGTAKTDQFQVSLSANANHFHPNVAMDGNGNYMVTWQSYNIDSAEYDIYARYYYEVPVLLLNNGVTVSNLSGNAGSWQYFKITLPIGQSTFDVSMLGLVGDADLYIKHGSLPSYANWDIRPYLNGSNERAIISAPPGGDWYIGINGYSSFSNTSLNAYYY